MTQEIESGPVDMQGLTPLEQSLRRANRCRMEFYQSGALHRCFLAIGHAGYHEVNEWGILYWAHSLQRFKQSTEDCMTQLAQGKAITLRDPSQTEEDMRKLPYLEMSYSVPCGVPLSEDFRKAK